MCHTPTDDSACSLLYIKKNLRLPHLIRLFLMVCEVATQVVLALVHLHELVHLLVLRVSLEKSVSAWDGPLQVIQLHKHREVFIHVFVCLALQHKLDRTTKNI